MHLFLCTLYIEKNSGQDPCVTLCSPKCPEAFVISSNAIGCPPFLSHICGAASLIGSNPPVCQLFLEKQQKLKAFREIKQNWWVFGVFPLIYIIHVKWWSLMFANDLFPALLILSSQILCCIHILNRHINILEQ